MIQYIYLLIIIILSIVLIIIIYIYFLKSNILTKPGTIIDTTNYEYLWNNITEGSVTSLSRYMYKRVKRGYKINLSIVKTFITIYDRTDFTNWYSREIGIPKYFFLSLYLDQESIKEPVVLELIDKILIKEKPIRDELANGYDVIVYYIIYNYLKNKYGLMEYPYSDQINNILFKPFTILDYNTDGIKNGIYNDNSFIFHKNIPYNTSYLNNFFESILNILLVLKKSKNISTTIINDNTKILFNCIIPFIYGKFINYNGLGRSVSRERIKNSFKELLYNVNLYNSTVKDYFYFDNIEPNQNFYNIDKKYLLKVSGTFVWYGKNYDIYIINSYIKGIENEYVKKIDDGDLMITNSNYSHSILFGDEDITQWYANNNSLKGSVILAGYLSDIDNNIINVNSELSIYDKISGKDITTIYLVCNEFKFYYIINRNLSMISVVLINLLDKSYYYYPISLYQNSDLILNNSFIKNRLICILSTLKPRYLILGDTINLEKSVLEISNQNSFNNYGRFKCYIDAKYSIMHISTKEITKIPTIQIVNDEPIYDII